MMIVPQEPLEADIDHPQTYPLLRPGEDLETGNADAAAEPGEKPLLDRALSWRQHFAMSLHRDNSTGGASTIQTLEPSSECPPPLLFGVPLRYLSLVLLVVQNTGLVLQMRYSLQGIAVSERYTSSTAVVLMEACKLVTCLGVLAWESMSPTGLARTLYAGMITQSWDFAKLAIPAFIYTLQNNILFFALARLDVTTFQITYQLKIVTTALFMRIMLAKQLNFRQWLALCLLMLGVIGIQVDTLSTRPADALGAAVPDTDAVGNTPIGIDSGDKHPHVTVGHPPLAAISHTKRQPCHFDLLLDTLSSMQSRDRGKALQTSDYHTAPVPSISVSEGRLSQTRLHQTPSPDLSEHLMSRDQFERDIAPDRTDIVPLVDDNAKELEHLEGVMAVLAACISSGFAGAYFEAILKESRTSLWMRNLQLSTFGLLFSLLAAYTNDYRRITDLGFLYGYRASTYLIVANQAGGGLLVAIVIKYADNLLKSFSTSFSIVLSCLCSIWLFEFQPTVGFACGAGLVLYAAYMYGKG